MRVAICSQIPDFLNSYYLGLISLLSFLAFATKLTKHAKRNLKIQTVCVTNIHYGTPLTKHTHNCVPMLLPLNNTLLIVGISESNLPYERFLMKITQI